MADRKWIMYEKLKELAGMVLEISQGSGQLWQQNEMVCDECERIADEICELVEE
jgi:hypothetical protein